jgi:hypothetical protein
MHGRDDNILSQKVHLWLFAPRVVKSVIFTTLTERFYWSQKVHPWLFAPRRVKSVVFTLLTDQSLAAQAIDPGAHARAQ